MSYPMSDARQSGFALPDRRHNAPVTCAACGCRLQGIGRDGSEAWFHFNPIAGRDARGCRVSCSDQAHDAAGVASVVTAA
jgi:hypothetical protein